MNQLKKAEWKNLYPIKKFLLMVIWVFCVFLVLTSLILLIRDGDIESIWIGVIFGGISIKTFSPIKRYIKEIYHCVPYLNHIFSRFELEELLSLEVFKYVKSINNDKILLPIGEGTHWISANGRFVSKDLAVLGWCEGNLSLIARDTTSIIFIYMTGEVIKIDLGRKLDIKDIISFNKTLWKEENIISANVLGEQEEEIINLFRKQFDALKKDLKLDEKEMIKQIILSPEKYKKIYMEILPHHIKKWCEEQNEEERKRLQSNGCRKNGSRE